VIRALALALALLGLSACGLRPLYGGGSSGEVAATFRQVSVATIPGRDGWLLYNKLKERLSQSGEEQPAYRLEVEIDDDIIGLGIRSDRAVTRERRSLRARYRLVRAATGEVVLDATAGSDAGIDVVSSEYATVAAEQTAVERLADIVADQIVARLAIYVTKTSAAK
jgi:LPS-assembly lipoprotein